MKKKNSNCEFSSERSEILIKNFRESLARQSRISASKAFKEAVEAPAPRFWVSEARAVRVVSMLFKGQTEILESMHASKREMFLEIFKRVKHIKETMPEVPLGDIVFQVVNDPAPKSYLTWQWAAKIIYARTRRPSTPFYRP